MPPSLLSLVSPRFRSTGMNKRVHVVVQSGKFTNKLLINLVTGGSLLLWDPRLLQVERWAESPHIFYNLSSLFVWSDVIALLVNRGAMTTQCQLHHTGQCLLVELSTNPLWPLPC